MGWGVVEGRKRWRQERDGGCDDKGQTTSCPPVLIS